MFFLHGSSILWHTLKVYKLNSWKFSKSSILIAGYLLKKSAKTNGWSRRWFVLNEKTGKVGTCWPQSVNYSVFSGWHASPLNVGYLNLSKISKSFPALQNFAYSFWNLFQAWDAFVVDYSLLQFFFRRCTNIHIYEMAWYSWLCNGIDFTIANTYFKKQEQHLVSSKNWFSSSQIGILF